MRQAPPVQVRSLGVGWRHLQCLLFALAAAAFLAWTLQHLDQPVWVAGPVGVLAAGAAWRVLPAAPVDLRWDGLAWQADGIAGRVDLMLDTAGWMLLRWRPVQLGPVRWIALSRRDTGAADHALRIALYARAPVAPDATTDLWRNP